MHRGVTAFLAVVAIVGLALVPARRVSAQAHPKFEVSQGETVEVAQLTFQP
jgi:hypothetical protein